MFNFMHNLDGAYSLNNLVYTVSYIIYNVSHVFAVHYNISGLQYL